LAVILSYTQDAQIINQFHQADMERIQATGARANAQAAG